MYEDGRPSQFREKTSGSLSSGKSSSYLEFAKPLSTKEYQDKAFYTTRGDPSSVFINEVIRVLNLTGTAEGLFIGNLVPSREDWFWFCLGPYSGFEFKEIEADTYEHCDLYMRHPTKPNLWAFKVGSNDLVVLSNGYKISPLEVP
ncbi:hypothetical protein BJX68DRAFT_268530 [Aspergillus pseudodeflectus]|uniref:Uncharacterized protein n=1 Tax=Aspergillus pseudodeflectus TaxID=176178 RepID=A0ABR4K3C0_9EURO